MKKHFVARDVDGNVLLVGINEPSGLDVTFTLLDFDETAFLSVDAIFMHPKVAYIEILQQIQENTLMTA